MGPNEMRTTQKSLLRALLFLSNLQPQVEHTLEVLDDLRATQLAFSVETVNKCDGTLLHLVAHSLGANHHLHLETVTLALGAGNDLLENLLLIETEATSQVAHTGHQHHVRDQVGSARGELAEQIPAVDTTLNISAVGVPGTSHDVGVATLLDANHLGDELGVVAEVGVHDDDEVAGGEGQTVDIGSSEAELALTGLQDDMVCAVELLELLRDFEGTVRGAIVNNDHLPVQVAVHREEGIVSRVSSQKYIRTFAHFSLKVFWSNQMIIGRFLRSL